jgi:hypothetical protein
METTDRSLKFVSVEAAGKAAGVSSRTIRYWITSGKLPKLRNPAVARGYAVVLEDVYRLAGKWQPSDFASGQLPADLPDAAATSVTTGNLSGSAAG